MKMKKYCDDEWVELKMILGYELQKTCVVLYLGNLTRENVQRED